MKPSRVLVIPALTLALVIIGEAQNLEFEVASLKQNPPGSTQGFSGGCRGSDSIPDSVSTIPLGRCVITAARLNHLLSLAFKLPLNQIRYRMINQGAWLDDRFDVQAKVENSSSATEEQLRSMLQNLLRERFKMVVHSEMDEVSGYALVPGPSGLKLKVDSSVGNESVFLGGGAQNTVADAKMNLFTGAGPLRIQGRRASMASLSENLAIVLRTPVSDQTALNGRYQFELSWNESEGPSVFTAVSEQLGLRLVSQKVPIRVLVVDSAQKPGEN